MPTFSCRLYLRDGDDPAIVSIVATDVDRARYLAQRELIRGLGADHVELVTPDGVIRIDRPGEKSATGVSRAAQGGGRRMPNGNANDNADEVADIEVALNVLVEVGIGGDPEPAITPARVHDEDRLTLIAQSEFGAIAATVCDDPLGTSARTGIRILGYRLQEIGGKALMSSIGEGVAHKGDKRGWPRRCALIDRSWKGIF